MKKIFVIVFFLLLSLIGCSQPAENSPSQEQLVSQEVTNSPTALPEPTKTEIPPTETPVPTATPVPTQTNTPTPTNTPTVTPTFSPETLRFGPDAPLKIGYLLWESHAFGIDSLRGIEIAISDFGGEILGHPVELAGFDSECNELSAQRGAQILVRDEAVIGILGTICSGGALRAAPIVSDGGRVLISPSNSSPELTAPDSRSAGYFRTSPNDIFQVRAVAQYAYRELGARRLATVYVAIDKFQKLQSRTLCEAFTELGGECVLERTMDAKSPYMAPILNSLVEAEPDAIYFMPWDFETGAAILSEARSIPNLANVALFIVESCMNPDFLQQAGDNALGVYVSTTSYDYDQESEVYQIFLDTYRTNFGEEPLSIYHPYAYDATTLLLKAIAQVAVELDDGVLAVDPMAVREALYLVEKFTGLTGLISCDPSGDCAGSAEGKVYEFTSGDPSTFNPGPADRLSSNPSQVWP